MKFCRQFKPQAHSADTICALCVVPSSSSCVVAAAGSRKVQLLSADQLSPVGVLEVDGVVKSIASHSAEPNMLWSASEDRIVRGWDLRTPKAPVLKLTTKSRIGALSCVANCGETGRVAAGSEAIKIDDEDSASVLLWDVRSGLDALTEYDEAHSDTVTNVCFSPSQRSYLCSGSLDGLVCVIDTLVDDTDDALESVLNAESSVSQAGFFGPSSEYAYCVTLTETVLFWQIDDAQQLGHHGDIRTVLERKSRVFVDYMVDCFYQPSSGELLAVAGSHSGNLHLLNVSLDGMEVSQSLPKHHNATVRCLGYDSSSGTLYTGDEQGCVSCWSPHGPDSASASAVAASAAAPVKADDSGAAAKPPKDTPAASSESGDGKPSKTKRQQKSDRKFKPY